MSEIVNRVANSKLETFNLEDYYTTGTRITLNIKDWLYQDLILKEKEFRTFVAEHDWEKYSDTYVAVSCSEDAIIPAWAYMLIASNLQPYCKHVIFGDLETLETFLYQKVLTDLDVTQFTDKPVIIKGCSNKPVPLNAYLMATVKLQAVAKSVMYGEACSFVPLFKRKD